MPAESQIQKLCCLNVKFDQNISISVGGVPHYYLPLPTPHLPHTPLPVLGAIGTPVMGKYAPEYCIRVQSILLLITS